MDLKARIDEQGDINAYINALEESISTYQYADMTDVPSTGWQTLQVLPMNYHNAVKANDSILYGYS